MLPEARQALEVLAVRGDVLVLETVGHVRVVVHGLADVDNVVVGPEKIRLRRAARASPGRPVRRALLPLQRPRLGAPQLAVARLQLGRQTRVRLSQAFYGSKEIIDIALQHAVDVVDHGRLKRLAKLLRSRPRVLGRRPAAGAALAEPREGVVDGGGVDQVPPRLVQVGAYRVVDVAHVAHALHVDDEPHETRGGRAGLRLVILPQRLIDDPRGASHPALAVALAPQQHLDGRGVAQTADVRVFPEGVARDDLGAQPLNGRIEDQAVAGPQGGAQHQALAALPADRVAHQPLPPAMVVVDVHAVVFRHARGVERDGQLQKPRAGALRGPGDRGQLPGQRVLPEKRPQALRRLPLARLAQYGNQPQTRQPVDIFGEAGRSAWAARRKAVYHPVGKVQQRRPERASPRVEHPLGHPGDIALPGVPVPANQPLRLEAAGHHVAAPVLLQVPVRRGVEERVKDRRLQLSGGGLAGPDDVVHPLTLGVPHLPEENLAEQHRPGGGVNLHPAVLGGA